MLHKCRSYLSTFLFLTLLLSLFSGNACAAGQQKVLVVDISDSITPVTDNIVADAIAFAENGDYEALVITLNTPGGNLDETLKIIEQIAATDVPVIGYVYPEGTKAWSAGTLILISTDVAAMAPYTIIGSAQPVAVTATGSEPIEDDKIINAIVKRATENAKMHGRNETAAEEFITKNLNLDPETALDYGVIEYVASDIPDLLTQVNGIEVKGKVLDTDGASITYYEPSLRLAFMGIISNPLVSSMLLLLGVYAIILGISHPGFGAELFGLIAIALGLIGTGFDVNVGALFLVVAGVILLVLEFQAPGFGVFGIAGFVCIIAGSILLVPTDFPNNYTPAEFQRSLIISVATPTIVIGLFFVFIIYKVFEVRRKKPLFGELIGDMALALEPIGNGQTGYVLHRGQHWKARSSDIIEKDDKVTILEKDGVVLVVEKLKDKSKPENQVDDEVN
ncbi:Nodulation efficiency protein NfeD [Methanolobus vulcani]|uniref:Nodulation efficiency protein NfeD n=1 Tax=Methanolobus vulcani TaxID=38026 RepID=A0A7Z7B154_9EURY|nr:nodulation protein NfeD [Methanolobus vulcani]SDG32709.1 Nodulation efficiency protein NfeD [Methanolobus vulcani]